MKLYISDLDGTLLRGDKSISSYTMDNLTKLREQGLKFTISTARGYESCKDILSWLDLDLPVVLANGVYVYDTRKNEYIATNDIDLDSAELVIKKACQYDQSPFVSGRKSDGEFRVYHRDIQNDGQLHYYRDRMKAGDLRFRDIEDYCTIRDFSYGTIVFIGEKAELEPLLAELRQIPRLAINFLVDIYSKYYWIEVNGDKATKGFGVEFMREHLGASEVICFGDNHNDIPMFKASDVAVAMNNAVDDVKALAHYVTDSNEEDGVANFILKHFR